MENYMEPAEIYGKTFHRVHEATMCGPLFFFHHGCYQTINFFGPKCIESLQKEHAGDLNTYTNVIYELQAI